MNETEPLQNEQWQRTVHDLRNALHSIHCGIDLLKQVSGTDAQAHRILALMQQDQTTAARLIDTLTSAAAEPR